MGGLLGGSLSLGHQNPNRNNMKKIYRRVQADLLALSQNSKAMIAPHSGHGIPMEDPGVLIGAIGKVIYAAQTKSALR
jgi:hypothetical protein